MYYIYVDRVEDVTVSVENIDNFSVDHVNDIAVIVDNIDLIYSC